MANALPHGDERRVGIARALTMRPRYLLLDEPAAGLNDAECDDLMALLRQIPGEFGCGVLLIEHNIRVVMGVCERIYVLESGRMIAEGPPRQVQNRPGGDSRVPRVEREPTVLEVSELWFSYRRVPALRGISFDVRESEVVALVGPNGAGKSTTMKVVSGLLPASQGTVRLDGRDIDRQTPEQVARLGVSLVPEGRHVFTRLNVRENLELGTVMGRGDAAHWDGVLGHFPFLRGRFDTPAGKLSGGEQQQLVIARALLTRPRLLLLDEPSLGPGSQDRRPDLRHPGRVAGGRADAAHRGAEPRSRARRGRPHLRDAKRRDRAVGRVGPTSRRRRVSVKPISASKPPAASHDRRHPAHHRCAEPRQPLCARHARRRTDLRRHAIDQLRARRLHDGGRLRSHRALDGADRDPVHRGVADSADDRVDPGPRRRAGAAGRAPGVQAACETPTPRRFSSVRSRSASFFSTWFSSSTAGRPKAVDILGILNEQIMVAGLRIPKIEIATISATIVLLSALALLLHRTRYGLQLRAASENFDMARLLGVRANTVIAIAFGMSGLLAGVVALFLVAQTGVLHYGMGLQPVLFAFVATVIGGMGSPGGRHHRRIHRRCGQRRAAGRAAAGAAPEPGCLRLRAGDPRAAVPSRRPDAGPGIGGPGVAVPARNEFLAYRVWPLVSLLVILTVPALIVWAAANPLLERTMTEALIMVVLVVGMQVFIGNSGVVSFGHVSFVAVAAYAAAWQTCCPAFKAAILPGLPAFLAHTQIPTIPSILAAIGLAGVGGFLIGLPIIRLTGIGASIAMFAVLSIVQTTYSNWDSVTGGESSIIGLPTYVDLPVALLGAAIAIAAAHVYKASAVRTHAGARRATTRSRRGRPASTCTGNGCSRSASAR